jgi:hypothetical protein
MPCACGKKKQQFAVVTQGGAGRQVYASSDKGLAVKVAARYPGSVVKDPDGTIVHTQAAPAPAVKASGSGDPKELAE